jgi:hypothetical protein
MALVDDRGRLLGRFNAVDVFLFVLVVVMIPVAYGAYALFRTPPAKLASVDPKQATMGPNLRVRVNGRNLRPFMRVSFNTIQGRTFMIGGTDTADVDLPDLAPGTYDVVLYDYAQEVDRLPKALTILPRVPAPTVTLAVDGVFVGLTDAQAAAITKGTTFAQNNHVSATVVAVGPRHPGAIQMRTGDTSIGVTLPGLYDVPAAIELECFLENTGDGSVRCVFYGPMHPAFVAADSILPLPIANGPLSFQVSDVHPAGSPEYLRLRVRTVIAPEIAARLRVGDSDSTVPEYEGAWTGRVEAAGAADLVLRLPAQHLANGWKYRDQWLKLNGGIRFETPTAVINGTIVDLAPIERAVSK